MVSAYSVFSSIEEDVENNSGLDKSLGNLFQSIISPFLAMP